MPQPSVPPDALPSVRVLVRLSVAALAFAAFLAAAVVLPAETGRDPIGLGRVLGLSEMGRIKVALAKEAATDSARSVLGDSSTGPAVAAAARVDQRAVGTLASRWRDSMMVTLQPTQGIEVKMTMRMSQKAHFAWTTDGGEVYFNMHGEPVDAPKDYAAHRYGKGTSTSESGEIVAAFDGVHGWFWRNRSDRSVTITLKTGGEYLVLSELK